LGLDQHENPLELRGPIPPESDRLVATDTNAYNPATFSDWLRMLRTAGLVVLRAALLLAAVLLVGIVQLGGGAPVGLASAVTAMACIYLAMAPSLRPWALYLIGFLALAQLRSYADGLGVPVQYEYPVVMEKALFFGTLPTVWLQDRLYAYAHLGPIEAYTTVVYLSFFIVPHAVALGLSVWDRPRFVRFAGAFMITVGIAVLVCAVLPTAPPWLAGQEGAIPHVHRVIFDVSANVSPGTYQQAYAVAGANPVAAMPSVHAAVTFLLAMALWKYRPWRPVGIAYALSMGFTVVYLGEHYTVDAIAGLGAAATGWWASARVASALRRRGRLGFVLVGRPAIEAPAAD
jgi:membrane-associated phospholipid phosphatase